MGRFANGDLEKQVKSEGEENPGAGRPDRHLIEMSGLIRDLFPRYTSEEFFGEFDSKAGRVLARDSTLRRIALVGGQEQ
jgi:hypothetical protein